MQKQIFHFSLFTFHFFCTLEMAISKALSFEKQKKRFFSWFFAHLFVPLQPLSA